MKVVAITGAGVSRESGISTFRNADDALWENFDPNIVSSKEGWKKDREQVIEFFNYVWENIKDKEPNAAHKTLADLENYCDVHIITQNVDNLHEKAGSNNVYHLHGDITLCRSSLDPSMKYPFDKKIKIGDKCEKGSQIRPDVVLYGEYPEQKAIQKAVEHVSDCDILLIIGTSLQITYLISILDHINDEKTFVAYIDPDPSDLVDGILPVEYIKEKATKGVSEFCEKLKSELV